MTIRLNTAHSRVNTSSHSTYPNKAQMSTPARQYRAHGSQSAHTYSQKTSSIENLSKIESIKRAKYPQNALKMPKAEQIAKNPILLKKLAEDYQAQAQEQEAHEISEFCMGMFRDSLIKTTLQRKTH